MIAPTKIGYQTFPADVTPIMEAWYATFSWDAKTQIELFTFVSASGFGKGKLLKRAQNWDEMGGLGF